MAMTSSGIAGRFVAAASVERCVPGATGFRAPPRYGRAMLRWGRAARRPVAASSRAGSAPLDLHADRSEQLVKQPEPAELEDHAQQVVVLVLRGDPAVLAEPETGDDPCVAEALSGRLDDTELLGGARTGVRRGLRPFHGCCAGRSQNSLHARRLVGKRHGDVAQI